MQHFKALRTRTGFAISLILGFALVTFGCDTSNLGLSRLVTSVVGKNQVSAFSGFEISAEAVPEGILITFSNIPSDTADMWIYVFSTEEPENTRSDASIIDNSFLSLINPNYRGWVNSTQQLEKVKQTGKIIFPFVQAGLKYSIVATVNHGNSIDDNYQLLSADTECIAKNGIYFDRNFVKLTLNDTNSVVTLSSEPVFSSEVTFTPQKYSFEVITYIDEERGFTFGDYHFHDGLSSDGLTWTFAPRMNQDLKETLERYEECRDWLESGVNYSAWATATAHIVYDDIKWSIQIAKTPKFTFLYN